MEAKNPARYIARSAKVFMTTLLIFLAVVIVQLSVVEIARPFWAGRPTPASQQVEEEQTEEERRIQRIQYARKEFLPDGTLHLVTEIGGPRWRPQYTPDPPTAQEQVYDVNDRLLWDGPTKERPYDYLAWAQYTHRDIFTTGRIRQTQIVMPGVSRALEIPLATADELLETWRYHPWSDCFIGYDLEGGKLGYLGAAGMTDSESQTKPFGPFQSFLAWWPPDSYSPTLLWQTERRIYQINFETRQVEPIFESPQSEIASMIINRWDSYRPEYSKATAEDRQLLHCRTRDGTHHVILKDPDQTITVTIPDEWKKWFGNHYEFAATEQGLFMRRTWVEYPARPTHRSSDWWAKFRETTRTQRVELYRVDETGTLDLVNSYRWTLPAEQPVIRYEDPGSHVKPNVNAFSPLLSDLVWTGLARRYRAGYYESSEWVREFAQFIEETRPGYRLRHWLVTTVLLVLTFLHGRSRRASKGAFVFWLAFVGLLNLAGFLTYWALNHTPTIKCSACGKHRGLTPTDCVRCSVPLLAPEHGKLDLVCGV